MKWVAAWWRWSTRNWWHKIIGIGAPVLFILFLAVPSSPDTEEVASATAPTTEAATVSMPATLPASPTATPLPPTTVAPSPAVPTVAPSTAGTAITPEPPPESSLGAYKNGVQLYLGVVGAELRGFSTLASAPNPTSEFWRNSVLVSVDLIQGHSWIIRELQPPACMQNIHTMLLAGLDQLDAFAAAMTTGVRNLDAASIERATAHLDDARQTISGATASLTSANCRS